MSQISANPQSVQSTVEPGAKPGPRLTTWKAVSQVKVMPQMRRDFAAALRRAGQNEHDSGDSWQSDQSGQLDQPTQMDRPNQTPPNLTVLGTFAPMQPSAMTTPQAASSDAGLSGNAMTALPNINRGTLPDAVPMKAGVISSNAADQQWRINVPDNDLSPSALAVRLVSASTGHWQVRLAADASTRAQLTPNLDRLRDKLRQRSDNRINDLEFDDGMGSESEART